MWEPVQRTNIPQMGQDAAARGAYRMADNSKPWSQYGNVSLS